MEVISEGSALRYSKCRSKLKAKLHSPCGGNDLWRTCVAQTNQQDGQCRLDAAQPHSLQLKALSISISTSLQAATRKGIRVSVRVQMRTPDGTSRQVVWSDQGKYCLGARVPTTSRLLALRGWRF